MLCCGRWRNNSRLFPETSLPPSSSSAPSTTSLTSYRRDLTSCSAWLIPTAWGGEATKQENLACCRRGNEACDEADPFSSKGEGGRRWSEWERSGKGGGAGEEGGEWEGEEKEEN
mmetsp:Transcript_43754/g.138294  ORF Transcript_43754/g.138294 Transcript_43754/m.138294 type:complete len:115 (-) Transcript_43754:12-356(-)